MNSRTSSHRRHFFQFTLGLTLVVELTLFSTKFLFYVCIDAKMNRAWVRVLIKNQLIEQINDIKMLNPILFQLDVRKQNFIFQIISKNEQIAVLI